MRVYICADIEGVTGVVSWGQCGSPNGNHADWGFARRMMTHDVNAAIRGARAGGATSIVVKDSHNTGKNLLIDELEPDVELISGSGSGLDGMMEGISADFDAALLVGYHGMAGTWAGIMEHTITGTVHRYWIGGMPAGEIAMSTATAGQYGVPLVMISSDEAGCREAEELLPGIATAVVKTGLGRYMGRVRHPSQTGPEIEAAARLGVSTAKERNPWCPAGPVTVKVEFNRSEEVDAASQLFGWTRLDAFCLEYTGQDWQEAHIASRRAMGASTSGASNNT